MLREVRIRRLQLALCLVFVLVTTVARAEDAFFAVPVHSLDLTEGSLPGPATQPGALDFLQTDFQPYANVEGGEAYIGASIDGQAAGVRDNLVLYARVPAGTTSRQKSAACTIPLRTATYLD